MLHNLNSISMNKFIRLFLGEHSVIVKSGRYDNEEVEESANKLIYEYFDIIGGSSHIANITRFSRMMNHKATIRCMDMCKLLISSGDFAAVSEVLSTFGYNISEEEHEKIIENVDNILNMNRYDHDKIMLLKEKVPEKSIDEDYFVNEKVILMQHYKMHIDSDKISAKEYAYLIKNYRYEVDIMNRSLKKNGRK